MKRVLIIDDEQNFALLTKKNLERRGQFEVAVCNDPQQALDMARRLHPNVILLDMVMPNISGEDLAIELKNHAATADIPVIFLTALVTPEETAEDHRIGGNYFVAKPVKIEELIEVIGRVVP